MEAEVKAAQQRAVVPLEIRMKQFRDMLAEKEVSFLNLQGRCNKQLNANTRHHVLGICVLPALTDLQSERHDLYSLCLIESMCTQTRPRFNIPSEQRK